VIPALLLATGLGWTVPAGWRTETIPFPLDFAPSLQHRGFEELRFSPGMFKPDAPDFWSYAFVWWLEGEQPPSNDVLQRELGEYFRGLSNAVAKGKYEFDQSRFKATLGADGAGRIETYDAFKTGKPITLRVRTRAQRCGAATALVVTLSPADANGPVWRQLDDLAAAFHCPH
jgi:hypothetical protein